MTKTCVVNPLKLQNVFCSRAPISLPLIFMAVDDKKFSAIKKSLSARPLNPISMNEYQRGTLTTRTESADGETIEEL
jgi:hypothetical protein